MNNNFAFLKMIFHTEKVNFFKINIFPEECKHVQILSKHLELSKGLRIWSTLVYTPKHNSNIRGSQLIS